MGIATIVVAVSLVVLAFFLIDATTKRK